MSDQIQQLGPCAFGHLDAQRFDRALRRLAHPASKRLASPEGNRRLCVCRQVLVEHCRDDEVVGEALVGEADRLHPFVPSAEVNAVFPEDALAQEGTE